MKRGPFTVTDSKVAYKNQWITVREDKVIRPDGREGMFGIIEYGAGVTIIALTAGKEVFLIREYYYALDAYGIQLPSGGIDEGENKEEAVKRELLEETGVCVKELIPLGMSNPLTMIVKSPAYLFLGLKAEKVGKPTDPEVESFKKPFNEVYKMAMDGQITYAGSIITILKAKEYLTHNNLI